MARNREANRIFGFDGWTRTTDSLNVVSDYEGLNKYDKPQWFVTYTATVTITVDGIVRTGTGAGHGQDASRGQAHESAIKEAETDATKRALMTFGNQFGLALYDKQQREVADKAPAEPPKLVVLKETPTDTHPQEVTPKKEEPALTTETGPPPELVEEWRDTDPLVFKRFLNEFRPSSASRLRTRSTSTSTKWSTRTSAISSSSPLKPADPCKAPSRICIRSLLTSATPRSSIATS